MHTKKHSFALSLTHALMMAKIMAVFLSRI